MRHITYIGWIILLLTAGTLAGQEVNLVDEVCVGSAHHYRVHGEQGSYYEWVLEMPDGTTELLPSDADTIEIHWHYDPGTYRLTVMQYNDEFYCDAIPVDGDVIIYDLPEPPLALDMETCYDGEEHSASAEAPEGNSLVWYEDEDGFEITGPPTGTEPGVYTAWVASVNNESGCESSERTEVTLTIFEDPPLPVADDTETCFDGNEHYATAFPQEGTSVIWYTTEDGFDTTTRPTGTQPGIYEAWAAAVDNDTNCENPERVLVTLVIHEEPILPVADNNIVCYDGTEHTATAYPQDNTSIIWYASETGDETAGPPTATEPGIYTAWAASFDADTGCESIQRVEVTLEIQEDPPIPIAQDLRTCYDGNEHTATASTEEGVSVIWYTTEDGSELAAGPPTATEPGTYTAWAASVSDDSGCENPERVLVTLIIDPEPILPVAQNNEVCYDGEEHFATALPQDDTSVVWYTTEDGFETAGPPTATEPGTYTAWAASLDSDTGCESSERIEVTLIIHPEPQLPVANNEEVCYDGLEHTATATPHEGTTVIWYASETGTDLAGPPTGTAPGTYTAWAASVVNDTDCESLERVRVTLTINPEPELPVADPVLACYDGQEHTATATAPAGSSLAYYTTETGNETTGPPAATEPGTYTAWAASVDNETGCETLDRTEVTLIIHEEPALPVAEDFSTCYDGEEHSAWANAAAGTSLVWYSSEEGSETASPPTATEPGIYTAWAAAVDDETGCESINRVEVTLEIHPEPDPPVAESLVVCYDGLEHFASATSEEGTSVVWYTSENGSEAGGPPTGTEPGLYTAWAATVVGDTNCESTQRTEVTLEILPEPPLPIAVNFETCFDDEEHMANAEAQPGTSLIWYTTEEGNEITNPPTATQPGIYTAWVASLDDDTGCESKQRVEVTLEIFPLPDLPVADNVEACYDGEEHFANAIPAEGTSIIWYTNEQGDETTSQPSGVDPGIYTAWAAAIDDETGCESSDRVEVTLEILPEPPLPVADDIESCFDGEEHFATAIPEEGTSLKWYATENGDETAGPPTGTQPGIYTAWAAAVDDITGCETVGRVEVTLEIYPEPELPLAEHLEVCYDGNEHIATTTPVEGTTLVWYTTEDGTETAEPPRATEPGIYTAWAAAIDDVTGCESMNRVEVILEIHPIPDLPLAQDLITCYDGEEHFATAIPAEGTTVVWYASETGDEPAGPPTATEPGIYTAWAAAVTEDTQCESEERVEVTLEIYPEPPLPLALNEDVCFDGEEHTATAEAAEGTSLAWYTSEDGFETAAPPTGTEPGIYTAWVASVDDATGCESTERVEVTLEIFPIPEPPVAVNDTVCYDGQEHQAGATSEEDTYIVWYESETGDALADGPPTGTAAGTYTAWAAAVVEGSSCESPERTEVTLVINPEPPLPFAEVKEVCYDGERHTHNAIARPGTSLIWYANETGDQTAGHPSGTEAGTYTAWAASIDDETGCISTGRTEVTLVINPEPGLPVAENVSVCYDGTEHIATASPQSGTSVIWYATQDGDEIAGPPTGTEPGIYSTWAAAIDNETGCETLDRTKVTLEIHEEPEPPVAENFDICFDGEEHSASAYTTEEGTSVIYYTTETGSETTGPPTATQAGIYTAWAASVVDDSSCESSERVQVTLEIYEIPLVQCPDNMEMLVYDDPVTLSGATPEGGTYEGPGVTAGVFDPATAGEGVHEITYTYTSEDGCTDWCTFTITVRDTQAAIAITKTADPQEYGEVGQEITYTITVENRGDIDLTNVRVIDPLTGLDTGIANFAAGDSQTYTETYQITQADMDAGQVTNTAEVTAEEPSGDELRATDKEVISREAQPALLVSKAADPPTYSEAGQTINYIIRVENTGNVPISNIAVTDPLTGMSENIPLLEEGEDQQFVETYVITQEDMDIGSVTNVANAIGEDPDGKTVEDSDKATIRAVVDPQLAVTKSADPLTYDQTGDEITYTITVENTGNVTISDIRVTDPLTGLDEVIPALAAGESQTWNEIYVITQEDVDNLNVTNVAEAEGQAPNGDIVSDLAKVTITSISDPQLTVIKSADPQEFTEAGDEITYTIVVTNTGNVTISNVRVTDPLTGLNEEITALVAGESQTYTETYLITQADMDAGRVINTATATGQAPNGDEVEDSDQVIITRDSNPGILVTKTADNGRIAYGAAGVTINYTIVVENTGDVTLYNVSVIDNLTGDDWTIPELPPGEQRTFNPSYVTTQADMENGSITNTARARGETPDGQTVTDEDTVTLTAVLQAEVTITKQANPDTYYYVGQTISYRIRATNSGNATLYQFNTVDEMLNIDNTRGQREPGESHNPPLTDYTVTQEDLDRGYIRNIATVTAYDKDDNQVTDQAEVIITAEQQPEIILTKTADIEEYDGAGVRITYTIVVENTGNVTLSNLIHVTDDLLNLSRYIDGLSPGETESITGSYITTQEDVNNGSVTNIAEASTTFDGEPVEASDDEIVYAVQDPTLAMTYTATPNTYSLTGDVVDFTVTVSNPGNIDLHDIRIHDELTDMTENIDLIATGGQAEATFPYTVTQDDLINGSINNTARVTAVSANGQNLEAQESLTVYADFNELIANDSDVTNQPVDGSTGGTALESVLHNDLLNGNPVQPDQVIITLVEASSPAITLDTNTGEVSVQPGTPGGIYTLKYRICEPLNVVNCDEATVTLAVKEGADLAITKKADRESTIAGGDLTYTLTVTNHGPNTAHQIVVTDQLPDGLQLVSADPSTGTWDAPEWSIAQLGQGEEAVLTLETTVDDGLPHGHVLHNTAVVTSQTSDPDPDNNQSSVSTPVVREADLLVQKTADQESVVAGESAWYTILIRNRGPSAAEDVVVTDQLPGGLTLLEAQPSTGTWDGSEWTIDAMEYEQEEQMRILVEFSPDIPDGTTKVNQASISSATEDPWPWNDEDSASIEVTTVADLAITKTADRDPAYAGDDLVYTLTVENLGPSDAQQVVVTDYLPDEVELIEAIPSKGNWNAPDWSIDVIEPGETITLELITSVRSDVPEGSTIVNTGIVDSETSDPDTGNNEASVNTTVRARADLAILKQSEPEIFVAGEEVTYTITVINDGPSMAQQVKVTDQLPDGLRLTNANPSTGTWSEPVWNIGNLDAGEEVTLTLQAVVDNNIPDGIVLANTATADSDTEDPNLSNNTSSTSNEARAMADLVIEVDHRYPSVIAGNYMHFNVKVYNRGPSDAVDADINLDFDRYVLRTDILEEGTDDTWTEWTNPLTIDRMAVGDTLTFTMRSLIASQGEENLTQTSSIFAETTDPDESNNVDVDVIEIVALADLIISKSASEQPVAGRSYNYEISVYNKGPSDAWELKVDNLFPDIVEISGGGNKVVKSGNALEWTVEKLSADKTTNMFVTARVPSDVERGTLIESRSNVHSETDDPILENNLAVLELIVDTEANLDVKKYASEDIVEGGSMVDFIIRVTNLGPSYSREVSIVDELPDGMTFVSADNGGHYVDYDHSIIWSVEELPDGESIDLTSTVRVGREVPGGTILTNLALATAMTKDPNSLNIRDQARVEVEEYEGLFIPEAFSPNGDGYNDRFVIGGLEDLYPNASIRIYTRWGSLLFEQDPYENDWDGKDMNNQDLPEGTYYYELHLEDGKEPLRKFIYLTR